jgi:ubiquinone/menaquinone biosynthesis C-methylase UbiE
MRRYSPRVPNTAPSPMGTSEPWDLVASGYVAENLESCVAFACEALRLVPATGDVLDVAAGPGSLTLQAARTAAHAYGVDFAPAMLAQLHQRVAAAGITNVTTQVADGQALPFPDGRFDAAYSMFGLIFFPNRARGLRELVRVLRPGARALVASWPPSTRIPMFAALFAAMKAELPGSGIGDAPAALGTDEDIHAEMGAAGFTKIEVHEHDVVPAVVTPAELWRSFSRGGAPAVLMRRRMGEDGFAAFSERIVQRLTDTLGPAPQEMKLTALFGIGTR